MSNPYLFNYDDLFESILVDYKNLDPVPDTSVGSQAYISAACLASAIWTLYKYQDYISQQPFPDTCDTDSLNHWGVIYGIPRLTGETDSQYSTRMIGLIRVPASGGTAQDYYTWVRAVNCNANVSETIDQSTLTNSSAVIPVVQDFQQDSILTPSLVNFSSTGVLPVPFVASTPYYVIVGGNNIQVSDSRGGAAITITDKQSGFLTISQDSSQLTYYASYVNILTPPNPQVQLGSVKIIFQSDDPNISGQPAETTLQTAIINAVNLYQPVTAIPASVLSVLPATSVSIDVTISGILPTSVSIQDIKLSIINYMSNLDPGQILYLTQLQSLCVQQGAYTATITAPSGDVIPAINEAIRPGTITVTY